MLRNSEKEAIAKTTLSSIEFEKIVYLIMTIIGTMVFATMAIAIMFIIFHTIDKEISAHSQKIVLKRYNA